MRLFEVFVDLFRCFDVLGCLLDFWRLMLAMSFMHNFGKFGSNNSMTRCCLHKLVTENQSSQTVPSATHPFWGGRTVFSLVGDMNAGRSQRRKDSKPTFCFISFMILGTMRPKMVHRCFQGQKWIWMIFRWIFIWKFSAMSFDIRRLAVGFGLWFIWMLWLSWYSFRFRYHDVKLMIRTFVEQVFKATGLESWRA